MTMSILGINEKTTLLNYKDNIKLGGITPSVLRELSGLYQPFEKALKELVVNSMDAGATEVKIEFGDEFEWVRIIDNGNGMTPYEFKYNFLHIGKNRTELGKRLTRLNFERVGGKGIGFLAPARYCSLMKIITTTNRINQFSKWIDTPKTIVDLYKIFNESILSEKIFNKYTTVTSIKTSDDVKLIEGRDYKTKNGKIYLKKEYKKIMVNFSIDCSNLIFEAAVNFDYLLNNDFEMSLEQIDDFCTISVLDVSNNKSNSSTTIILQNTKEFVRDSLKQASKKGNVKNIASKSGVDQFVWKLTQALPVKYDIPSDNYPKQIQSYFTDVENKIEKVTLKVKNEEMELIRPIFQPNEKLGNNNQDIWLYIDIEQGNFIAKGYIIGQSQVIYPSEIRGLSIKVKNVEVGSPSFFGFEHSLTGAKKAALNQITGEINVISGIDPNYEINPGRDGFYKESKGYEILRNLLVGEDEKLGGIVNKIVQSVINRSQMHASVDGMFKRAKKVREGMVDLSKAINNYVTINVDIMDIFEEFDQKLTLVNNETIELSPEQMLTSYRVRRTENLKKDFEIDFMNKVVIIDGNKDIWRRTISVLGEDYKVIFKKAKRSNKLCEINTKNKQFLINWDHSTRQLMDDKHFIKNAVGWAIAQELSKEDPDEMINIALHLTTFKS